MLENTRKIWGLMAFVLFVSTGGATGVAANDGFATGPCLNKGGKWRIAYYQGGHHENYYHYLKATVEGLMALGWIKPEPVPESPRYATDELWHWLTLRMQSNYLQFVPNGYYSADWDTAKREKLRVGILARLQRSKDIDLVIAMGTWAGKDLATGEHTTPTMVMSTSDPLGSGIIRSVEDSGYDHVHARVDPYRYERQIKLFHDIIKFKRLGIAYEDSIYGRTYAAVDQIEKVARQRGFKIVHCYTQSDIADVRAAGTSVINCFEDLIGKVDAIYVTQQGGVNPLTLSRLARIATDHQVPTFSQLGTKEVRQGLLLSISRAGYKHVGKFHAATFAKVFNGAQPRQLVQQFEEPPKFAINLKTAEKIGLYLYADFLAAADEIFHQIEAPK